MSVRPFMAASNFHSAHRPNWPQAYLPPHHPFCNRQFQQFHPPPYRTMALLQGPRTTASGYPAVTSTFNPSEPSFFEDSLQQEYTPSNGDHGMLQQQWPDSYALHVPNFRSADSMDDSFKTSFGSTSASSTFDIDDTVPRKVDNSPTLPALSYKVDTSKYENVDYDDYLMTPMEYDSSSLSSIETESTGPPTPSSTGIEGAAFRSFCDDAYLAPRRDSCVTKVENAPLQSRPNAMAHGHPTVSLPTGSLPLSMIFDDAQPPATQFSFALHPHVHGGLIDYSNYPQATCTNPQAVTPESFNLSTSSISSAPELERPFIDSTSEEDSDSDSSSSHDLEMTDRAVSEAHHRRDRDRYLLRMREKGHSYKEIKRLGRFTEAESTLRGRVRVMTKHKSERVRKPVWTEHDVQLLEAAIERFLDGDSTRDSHGRIPWKRISHWMRENGSSYFFAGATCAKKWKSLTE